MKTVDAASPYEANPLNSFTVHAHAIIVDEISAPPPMSNTAKGCVSLPSLSLPCLVPTPIYVGLVLCRALRAPLRNACMRP